MEIDKLTYLIINLCIKIHSKIGPGCYEKVYEEILCYELENLGIGFKRQLKLPVIYEGLKLKKGFKLDLIIDNKLITEIKTLFPLPSVYFKQVHTYLSLMNLKHGMLINFKVNKMKEGIHRVFNNFGGEQLEKDN